MDKLREILIDYKFNDGDLDKALSEIQEIRKAEVLGVVEIAETIDSINSFSVAYFFLKKAQEENKTIANLKLQKLVYYAGVWYYTFFNKKLFSEGIEAWIHGPAIPRLYGRFKVFGMNPIVIDGLNEMKLPFKAKDKKFLNDVWTTYGKYDATYLEALTHSELPWQEARKGLEPGMPSKRKIDFQKAKLFYARKLTESK